MLKSRFDWSVANVIRGLPKICRVLRHPSRTARANETLPPMSVRRVDIPSKEIKSSFPGIRAQFGVAIAVAVIGLFFVKHMLATVFRDYDDEGYVLISLSHYVSRSHLYTETYSQYGPFYFYAQETCFRLLRLPVTHDAGRLVTLLYWLAAGLLGAWFVYRISNNLLLGCAAGLACIRIAAVLANEPGHPQQIVLSFLTLSCCLSLSVGSGRKVGSLFLLGAVGAALVFTKINVGAFYLVALTHTLLCVVRPNRAKTIGLTLIVVFAVITPVLLMRSHLWEAQVYCSVAALCGGVTFACGSLITLDDPLPFDRVLYVFAGLLLASAMIVVATVSQGMSGRTLIQGVLLAPVRHPQLYSVLLWINRRYYFFALLIISCLGALWLFRNRWAGFVKWVGALRCAAGLTVVFLLLHRPNPIGVGDVLPLSRLALCCAFLPLSLIHARERNWRLFDLLPRLFLSDLAVTQFLQAYPVAGSQVSIAAAPMLLWGFVSILDGVDELPDLGGWGSRPQLKAALSVLILLALSAGMVRPALLINGYMFPQSKLRGSTSLHLPPDREQDFRFLAGSIGANCSLLFSLPGMSSFNFWSGVPAPNGSNHNNWMRTFSPERQKQILDILQSNPRACVLYNKKLVAFWGLSTEDLVRLPLARYIIGDMPLIVQRGDYEIRANPRRNSPWIEATVEVVLVSSHDDKDCPMRRRRFRPGNGRTFCNLEKTGAPRNQ